MSVPHPTRTRLAGALTAAGLLIELLTFRWSHPIGFSLMLVGGGGLVVLGVGLYLWALLAEPPPQEAHREPGMKD